MLRALAVLLLLFLPGVVPDAVPAAGAIATSLSRPDPRVGPPSLTPHARLLRQRLWVRTPVDTDGDGRRDRVSVTVTRPRRSEVQGHRRLASIMLASPYNGGIRDVPNHRVRVPLGGPRAPRETGLSGLRDGYAHVEVDSLGSGGSTGCPTSAATRRRRA